MLGITSTGSRLRLDSFNVKKLDPSISCKFCVTQYRRGLFGFSNQRYVILHLKELSMNVVDKRGLDSKSADSLKVKSYKTSAITRLSKHKGTSIGVHMQRNGGEEVVKEYTFASAQDRDMFERTVNVMNRYGTVVNHVFDESVTKAVSNARFSYVVFERFNRSTLSCFNFTGEYHSHRSLILQEKITRKNQRSNTNSIVTKTFQSFHTFMFQFHGRISLASLTHITRKNHSKKSTLEYRLDCDENSNTNART